MEEDRNYQIAKEKDELREKLVKENKKIKFKQIDYYEEFQIINQTDNYMGYSEKDIFIVEKEEMYGKNVKTFDIYNRNKEKIAETNAEGILTLSEEYKANLKEKLGDYYPQLGLEDEDRKMYLHEYNYVQDGEDKYFTSKEKGFIVNDKPKEELTKEEKTQNIEEVRKNREKHVDIIDPELIKEDLGLDSKDFGTMIKIKDKRFYEKVPGARELEGDAILMYNNRTNKFMVIGMEKGKYVECKGIEPSVGTMKTSIDLDKKGENVEKQAIGGIMKIKGNNDFDFAVNLEPGGTIEFQELRKASNGKYISADLRTQGQYATSWEVDKMMNKKRNNNIYDEIEEFKTEQKHGHKSTVKSLKDKECLKEEKENQKRKTIDGHEDIERELYNLNHY